MRTLKHVVWAVAAAAILGASAHAAEPIVIKFSHVVSDNTPKGKAALRFKEVLERRAGGRVRVEVYPDSKLFKDKEEMPALLEGKVEMLAPSVSKLVDELGVNEFEIFALPFIFPGKDLLRRVTDGPVGQSLFKKLEPKGVTGLAYWDNAFRLMHANRPLHKPQDFKGLKMRVSSKAGEPVMRALGANPVITPFKEVYGLLKSGEIDGTENAPSNIYTQKMHEAQKHITISHHSYLGYAVIVNKKFWDNLPPDIRVHTKLAMIDATRFGNLYAERENEEALAKIKAAGTSEVYNLSIDERNQWRRAMLPLHKDAEARVGKQLLQTIYREGAALGYKY